MERFVMTRKATHYCWHIRMYIDVIYRIAGSVVT